MKHYTLILATLLSLLIPVQSCASDYSGLFLKGTNAYMSGDYATALDEFAPLAEEGHSLAHSILGMMHHFGGGESVGKDYVKAYMRYTISYFLAITELKMPEEHIVSKDLRDIIAKKMTPSQIEDAQSLARECVAKDYKGC